MLARGLGHLAVLVAATSCGGTPEVISGGDAGVQAAGGAPGEAGGESGGAPGDGGLPSPGGRPPRDAAVQGDASRGSDAGPDGATPDATAGEGGSACDGSGARFVTGVVSHAFGLGQDVGQTSFPALILGPPRGGGCCQGSVDTVSIGNGGQVVVEFEGTSIVDGPGPDFIVFENAFNAGGDETAPFAELATVAVSADGVVWTDFPCTATAYPYGACAGWRPVLASAGTNDIDPLDPAAAGGDPFDLADIGVTRARYVRITDREDLVGFAGVFDLDAVGVIHSSCP